jgi:hypothetical protein
MPEAPDANAVQRLNSHRGHDIGAALGQRTIAQPLVTYGSKVCFHDKLR